MDALTKKAPGSFFKFAFDKVQVCCYSLCSVYIIFLYSGKWITLLTCLYTASVDKPAGFI